MLRIILADAELELVPEGVAGHPQVRTHAKLQNKRPGDLLLDQNLHRQACKKLEGGDRRGRPDITQYTLLNLLEGPLCKEGKLEVAVHARDGTLVRIRPDTRLPRGEQRFHGLVSKVLRDGASQDKDPLLWTEGKVTPAEVLTGFAVGPVLRYDESEGVPVRGVGDLASGGDDLTVVLPGFPRGDYSEAWKEAAPETFRVFGEPLNTWTVAAEVAAGVRASRPSAASS